MATDDATVATAKTAAPAMATANVPGWSASWARTIARPRRNVRRGASTDADCSDTAHRSTSQGGSVDLRISPYFWLPRACAPRRFRAARPARVARADADGPRHQQGEGWARQRRPLVLQHGHAPRRRAGAAGGRHGAHVRRAAGPRAPHAV